MALVVADRVKETTATTGTGTYTLAGAETGFQSFLDGVGDGNTTYYVVTNDTDWEVGIGTFTASGTTLSRDTILASSNSGAAVNWGAGPKQVFVTYPAGKAATIDRPETLTNKTINGSNNTITNVSLSTGVTGTLPLTNGGTGASLIDPNADRILFWDDSAGAVTWLQAGSGLSITDTTISASGGSLTVEDDGTSTVTGATALNFAGTGVSVTDAGGGEATITIPGATAGAEDAFYFGDGSDGNVTISSGTTRITRDTYYNNLTISGTGKLDTGCFRVFVKDTLDITAAGAESIFTSVNTGNRDGGQNIAWFGGNG
jgi:hypothetical protein